MTFLLQEHSPFSLHCVLLGSLPSGEHWQGLKQQRKNTFKVNNQAPFGVTKLWHRCRFKQYMEYNYGICGIPINQLNKMIQSCLCISQFQLRGVGGGGRERGAAGIDWWIRRKKCQGRLEDLMSLSLKNFITINNLEENEYNEQIKGET